MTEPQKLLPDNGDTDWIDWSEIEWNADSAAAFFAVGDCGDDECEHVHSHFENLRAEILSALDDLAEEPDAEEQVQHVRESLDPVFTATALRLKALMTGWISVDERLPGAGDDVLCFSAVYGEVNIACFNGSAFLDADDCLVLRVTHWMPLPDPPVKPMSADQRQRRNDRGPGPRSANTS